MSNVRPLTFLLLAVKNPASLVHTLVKLMAVVCLSCIATLQGCSSQQIYGAGQAWQRQECNKIADAQERGRCMASASSSYEEYKRQAEAAKTKN